MKIDTFFKRIENGMAKILVVIFGLLVLDVLWQVFSRYILKMSFSFTEEFARFSLIWLSILGAAYLNARREHLSMDFLYRKWSTTTQRKASIVIEVLVFLFAAIVMVIGGFNLVYITLHLNQLSGTLRIPLGYVYMILPISGLIIMMFSVYHISGLLTNKIRD
ncbi:TRAP-type transport system, small permease compo nent, predicted N-acetylneuraminate transporter [Formosa agariphila KMM 3901]|uniref:TRAP-type transport system, small permease compo nent, predicted N-acetylneuraminate transporter n=1 Tax=Formosa agariphila (strain DSM 15362 / KCTC 12365 / LMG 23005 / KMM 3901 / M-2Alg 35-1) TaxID=1347342 RepID=T2KIF7_FORAG|nr:TRAP transporter small permease [Formosa agariphila]CDF78657.1 TRAP-type transport system, small permease compo nent, predicted N-acetylneuraminate transporter [Formosa agariphila KMM 3901]